MTDHFVVTLDSRNQTVTGNVPGRFSTRFPKPLEADVAWEVALWEIRYPKTWWTVTEDATFSIDLPLGEKVVLPPGFYPDPQRVVEYLNKEIERFPSVDGSRVPKLRFLPNNNRIELISGDGLHFSQALASMLGFDPSREIGNVGEWEVDLNNGFHHLFIYTDVIADGLVGDTSAPLLRAPEVRNADAHGSMVYLKFEHPYYLPVRRGSIETLEILITNEFGDQIVFRGEGSVLVTLHFRKHDKLRR